MYLHLDKFNLTGCELFTELDLSHFNAPKKNTNELHVTVKSDFPNDKKTTEEIREQIEKCVNLASI